MRTLSVICIILLSFFLGEGFKLKAQLSYKVLFLGNSYTYVNNLPQLIKDAALSAGDTLIFDSYAPGGYQLEDHSLDVNSQNKIMTGGWDYVVIQGQSQEPIAAYTQFTNGGSALYNQIRQYNSCAVVMPYMTWGRKNGDASNCGNFPIMCTYQGMDTTIRDRYLDLAAYVTGEVSPVSVVWQHLRKNHPGIELYQPDESHPSAAGSYAAACCFYTCLFKKDPTLITFNFNLSTADASIIRNAVKSTVFTNLQSWDFKKLPSSKFAYTMGPGTNQVLFSPISMGAKQSYSWNFGDAASSFSSNPTHSYLADGTYTVSLTTSNCDLQGIHTSFTDTVIQFCAHTPGVYTPHAWLCNYDTLWTQTADSYQWFYNGISIPETNQYLANYAKYNASGFSVFSTFNGCSELSKTFTQTAQWSGYYFDIWGNPCADTVPFIVKHSNGFLNGSEKIWWYRNGTLLSSMNNEDTLFISGSGKYQCKVIDPNTNCPYDTTSYTIEYNCGPIGIEERNQELALTLFPNPASENITIKFTGYTVREQIEIYNYTGQCVKSVNLSAPVTRIEIAGLPDGLYSVRLKNNKHSVLRFIKQ